MNYSKFETESGIQFLYDNVKNQILELDLTPVTPGMLPTEEELKFAEDNYATTKKISTPRAIRLLMGHACNFSCSYCLQKDIGNPNERPGNLFINVLLKQLDKLDLSELSRVELWGGEPFLYWKDMETLLNYFDRPGLSIGITTNGSALRQKHADFFASLKGDILMSISHDAHAQELLRGKDPLQSELVINTLKEFDKLPNVTYGFLCSVTNTNYNLFEINDFFRDLILKHDLKCNSLSFSLGRTYSTEEDGNGQDADGCMIIPIKDLDSAKDKGESFTHVIHGENLKDFREILREYLEQHYLQMIDSYVDGVPTIWNKSAKETPLLLCDIYESIIPYSVTEFAGKILRGDPILESTNCGADMSDVLQIDMGGNVRTCVHSDESHIVGNIRNMEAVVSNKMDFNRGSHCEPCPNKLICRSSCPLELPDRSFLANCAVEKVWYGEIQNAAFRFILNSPTKLVEHGISINSIE